MFKPLTDPKFVVPVAIVAAISAIVAVYVWNNHAVQPILNKTGKDLTA
jgi:hypothetical protein